MRLVGFALLAVLPLLEGCIAFPTAVPERRPYGEDIQNLLAPGLTAREHIESSLGSPLLQGQDWWLYRDTRDGWAWLFCVGGAYSAGCGQTNRTSKDYFLAIDFDTEGIVDQFQVLTASDLCGLRRICYAGELLMMAATPGAENASKAFATPAGGCSMFLYTDVRGGIMPSRIRVDHQDAGAWVSRDGFYHVAIDAGEHDLIVIPARPSMSGTRSSMRINCHGQELIFVRYWAGFWGLPRLEVVEEPIGRRAIEQRWLADSDTRFDLLDGSWVRDGVYVAIDDEKLMIYEYSEKGPVKAWGTAKPDEACGIVTAVSAYGLAPRGNDDRLFLLDSSDNNNIDVRTICRRDGTCEFPSVVDALPPCSVVPATEIEFVDPAFFDPRKLLVLEPPAQSQEKPYSEIYFGTMRQLRSRADCHKGRCVISVDALREHHAQ